MNVCIIDIGSNTVKASVYKIISKSRRQEIAYKGSKEKLITCIDNGIMNDEGIKRLCNSLESLLSFSTEYKCERIFAFATASLRNVNNADDIIDIVENKFGVTIEILSEEDEALCSLKGLLSDFSMSGIDKGVMIDMGGGSTELVTFENGKMPKIRSMKFGCLSLIDDEFGKDNYEYNIRKTVKKELEKCTFAKDIHFPVFLIGGTARAVNKILNVMDGTDKNNLRTDGMDFERIAREYNKPSFRAFLEDIVPYRQDTVVSGAIAYSEIINFIKPVSVSVSESGVRDGYLEKILP